MDRSVNRSIQSWSKGLFVLALVAAACVVADQSLADDGWKPRATNSSTDNQTIRPPTDVTNVPPRVYSSAIAVETLVESDPSTTQPIEMTDQVTQTAYQAVIPNSGTPYAPQYIPSNMGSAAVNDDISIAFGFDFLQPSWSNDAFTELLPGGTAALFPGLNVDTRIEHDYGLAPRFEVGWGFGDSDYGLTASGNFLSLSGNLRQNVGSGTNNESIQGDSVVNIMAINLPEVSKVMRMSESDIDFLGDSVVEFRLGTRYSTINQVFTASLRRGTGAAVTTSSFQDFRGVGLTTAINMGIPMRRSWWIYGKSRGSMMVGSNKRQANFSLLVPGGGAGTTSNTLSEDKTDIIPVGEFEIGVIWDNRDSLQYDDSGANTLTWLKLGYVAQVWGDTGLISAATGNDFRDGHLTLMGFSLQAGIER